jgi:hypothetical protein
MAAPAPVEVVPDPVLGIAASQELVKAGTSADDFWPSLGRSLGFALLFLAAALLLFGSGGLPAAAFGLICTWVWLCVFQQRKALRMVAAMWTAPQYRLVVDEEGLSARSDGGSFWRIWGRATRLIERDDYVMIAFDGLESLTVPTACFGTPEAREAWLAYVRERIPATAPESSIQ